MVSSQCHKVSRGTKMPGEDKLAVEHKAHVILNSSSTNNLAIQNQNHKTNEMSSFNNFF